MAGKNCPDCGRRLRIEREEYEKFCDSCMQVWGMARAAYNDMKVEAADFNGSEEEFAKLWMGGVRGLARKAYQAVKGTSGTVEERLAQALRASDRQKSV